MKDKWHEKKHKECEGGSVKCNSKNKPNKVDDKAINRNDRTEAVFVIPFTPNSALKRQLQEWDNNFSRSLNIPRIRFIEKGVTKLEILCVRAIPGRRETVAEMNAKRVEILSRSGHVKMKELYMR